MLAECCFGRGGDIVEQDLDLSEGSSAQVQNKGNENDFWIPVSIVEQTGVVLVFR